MLYAFGFETIGIVAGDLYLVNPEEGAEHGVRLEVRMFERDQLKGSGYSAQPIAVARPLWRADLLESVDGAVGSFDRAHYHPSFDGWEPSGRHFTPELSSDPIGWVGMRLSDLDGLLDEAGVDASEVDPQDSTSLRDAVPEIVAAVKHLWDGICAGQLASGPGKPVARARIGWL